MNIRLTHLRQADLNLLVYFSVLAEERNISRAAARLRLSQPSISRALARLRRMFEDDLLVRVSNGYELTAKARALLQELAGILPQLDRLVGGSPFDPEHEAARFRLGATDNAAHLFSPVLCRRLASWKQVVFDFQPWHDGVYDDLDHGRMDLLFAAQDGLLPRHLRSEVLFDDEVVCVVSRDHPLDGRLTFRQYLAGQHIDVTLLNHSQSFLERDLAKRGLARRNVLHVPYFSVAIQAVAGTRLMTTVPCRVARLLMAADKTKMLRLPKEIGGYQYVMAWHARVETDTQHQWLRQTVREAAKDIQPLG